ncbi:MAG: CHRD domain-containing protein [Actinobacteria bacterium]|nr:CHRD domain-containing protein [Actinomycetota bacterium]
MRRMSIVIATATLVSSLLVALPVAAAGSRAVVRDFAFDPDPIVVKAGGTVVWDWAGAEPHTVTGSDFSFDSGTRYRGDTYAVTFTEPGIVPYFCKFHGDPEGEGMAGTVIVEPTRASMISGDTNIDRALNWSRWGFDDGSAPTVLLARNDVFADSLSSGPAQGALGAPLLLTLNDRVVRGVEEELTRLGAQQVILLGGPEALQPQVEARLVELGYRTRRVFGDTRLTTATATAAAFFPSASQAIIARAWEEPGRDQSQAFADSLGAGALGANLGIPVLLSRTEALSPETSDYLSRSGIRSVIIAGGPDALSDDVEEDLRGLGLDVDRAGGETRFETATELFLRSQAAEHADDFVGGMHRLVLIEAMDENAWAAGFPAAAHTTGASGLLLVRSRTADTGANDTTLDGVAFQALMGGRPHVVCGPNLASTSCAQAQTASNSGPFFGPRTRLALMTGEAEVDDEGDPSGLAGAGGAGDVRGTPDGGALCYSWFSDVPEPVAAAHVHEGAEGVNGPPVVPLLVSPGLFGDPYGCTFGIDEAVVADILANPGGYYLNLHTESFPGGAVRGQLLEPSFLAGSFTTAEEAGVEGLPFAGGFGFFVGNADDPTELCYFTFAFGTTGDPTAQHIHDVETGGVVVPLETPEKREFSPEDVFYVAWDCAEGLDEATVAAIGATPSDYYLNVHTEANPGGELKGLLFTPDPPHDAPVKRMSMSAFTR